MEIHLVTAEKDLRIPQLPESFEVSDSQNNETVVLHTVGEINLVGKPGLRTVDISSTFPLVINTRCDVEPEPPYDYIKQLKMWKDSGTIVTLHITEGESDSVTWDATIEELKHSRDDATGDVSYTINLKEYRQLERRVTKKTSTTKYKVKSGDTLKKLAYKYLGATKYSSVIYTQNKNAIEKAAKAYIKKYNKEHPKKKLKWKTSEKGKHLIKGTNLVIKKSEAV